MPAVSTSQWIIRRHVSADPLFTFLRPYTRRKRAFRYLRRRLIDALFILFINKVDLATDIVTINITKLAEELSPKDSKGKVIQEQAVTVSRVSRLVTELADFGFIHVPQSEWDIDSKCRFPKHVILTEAGWRLTGIDMDKLRAEQAERRAAIEDGMLAPGETISLKAARSRWYARCRIQTILARRTHAVEGKQRRKLIALPFDERKRQVSEGLLRSLKGDPGHMTSKQFEKMVWAQLYRLGLVSLEPPETSPPL
ncbi:replication initiator protein RepA [Kosakonia quasisacchari]|uniref:Replication initiation protein n=1 Tax=Kosakonia quasisacchari TaxID=2529380 RepID=A0A4V6N3A2_9ENTR|nr:plasmid replication initiator RepA [Kosakonia quasisacchari]TCB96665.1 replication initiator protein RepA [Kosakonia quasisacchari]